jgi:hypothetical protein
MKKIAQFVDEASGLIFKTAKAALKSENKHRSIKKIFSWIGNREKRTRRKGEDDCKFANGGWSIQWSEADYERLINCIWQAVHDHERWIYNQYKGGLTLGQIRGQSALGHYLSDNDSSIYHWYTLQMEICPKCFRQYGQPYYAINCHCDGTSGGSGRAHTIPTRELD